MKRIFTITTLFFMMMPVFSQVVTIGTGTSTTSSNPVSSLWGYSYTQQLYTQAEMLAGGISVGDQITHIRFYWDGSGNLTNTGSWVVYLGNTTQNVFINDNAWVSAGSITQVYNGAVSLPAVAGWMTITL